MKNQIVLLAIETSTPWSSVALLRGTKLITETGTFITKDHSGPLASRIDTVIRDAGVDVEEITAVAVSAGPGSFTGLRVGVGFAKGFICGTKRHLYAVSSLETLAAGLPFCDNQICSFLDARKGEVYAGIFRWEGDELVTVKESVSSPPGLLIDSIEEETVFVGSGCSEYRELLENKFSGMVRIAPGACSVPRAGIMGQLAFSSRNKYLVKDPPGFEPVYIRPPEAVVKWRQMG